MSCFTYLVIIHVNPAQNLAPTVWPSGLRRWLKAPGRKGVGSNPTAVTVTTHLALSPFGLVRVPHAARMANASQRIETQETRKLAMMARQFGRVVKALAPGASPQGREFEPRSCHRELD